MGMFKSFFFFFFAPLHNSLVNINFLVIVK